MPSSLRWLMLLLIAAILVTLAAGGIMYAETRSRTRIMAEQASGGSARAGRTAILAYGCGSCHDIPGIDGANGSVGPSLAGIATRTTVAGRLPHTPDAMTRWIRHPQAISPGSGMPEQGVSEQEARDIAAYLYGLT